MIENFWNSFWLMIQTFLTVFWEVFCITMELMGIPLVLLTLTFLSFILPEVYIPTEGLNTYNFWAGFFVFLAIINFQLNFLPSWKRKTHQQKMYEDPEYRIKYQDGRIKLIEGDKSKGKTNAALLHTYDFASQYPDIIANVKEVLYQDTDSILLDKQGNKHIFDKAESIASNSLFYKAMRHRAELNYLEKWKDLVSYPKRKINPHTILISPPYPQPTKQFYCHICMEKKKEKAYICGECERYVCASCFEDMKQVEATQCPYCKSELKKCRS